MEIYSFPEVSSSIIIRRCIIFSHIKTLLGLTILYYFNDVTYVAMEYLT